MNLSKTEVYKKFELWLAAWNRHDLDGVMDLMHINVLFENWDGKTINGKELLHKLWIPWFANHNDFKFIQEDVFFDEEEQKMIFQWILEWHSIENKFKGEKEIRKGVDILEFKDGKIFKKVTYTKTTIQIGSTTIQLHAI